jgi:beta-galactosidase
MLPLRLTAGGLRIAYATAAVGEVRDGAVTFRTPGGAGEAVVAVEGRATCQGARSRYEGGRTLLRVRDRADFTVQASS